MQPDNIIIGPGGTTFSPVKGPKPLNGKARPAVPVEQSVILKSAADYTPEPIDWLWRDWLAKGKLHLLAGAPGTGKTTIGIALAAAITSGGIWPDGAPVDAGDVLIWSGEDGISDTLLPRFLAAGGNKDRLHFVAGREENGETRSFDPSTDMSKLYDASKALPAIKLLLLDPVVAAVAADSHKNTEVRRGLQPVVDLAERLQCAVLGITHLSKNTSGREPLERIAGSIAFGAVARVALATVRPADQDAPRRLVRAKSNIGPDSGGFEYTLFSAPVPGFGFNSQTVEWGQMLEGTARELMAVEQPDNEGEREDAEAFLLDTLRDGPAPTRDIRAAATAHGHGWRTVNRAKQDLGVKAVKLGMKDGWAWQLPESPKNANEER
jgi:putative DNA primase/helicase